MKKRCQCVCSCVSVHLSDCFPAKCECVCVDVCVCLGLHALAGLCFLSGQSLAGDKEKVKAERTADSQPCINIV